MPLFRIHGVIACFTALLTLLSPSLLSAQDPLPLHLRLIAADRPSRPLVSEPTDFRYSPVGGLIVTDWFSGVKVGERALFPLQTIPSPDRLPRLAPIGSWIMNRTRPWIPFSSPWAQKPSRPVTVPLAIATR